MENLAKLLKVSAYLITTVAVSAIICVLLYFLLLFISWALARYFSVLLPEREIFIGIIVVVIALVGLGLGYALGKEAGKNRAI